MSAKSRFGANRLHKFMDDYLDTVRNDLIKRIKGDSGDLGSISKILAEIKQMIVELRIGEKQLYCKVN